MPLPAQRYQRPLVSLRGWLAPLMLAVPSVAIDLPLKILVWEDAKGKVWVSYNSPAYLQERHGFPPELLKNIAVVEALATQAAE